MKKYKVERLTIQHNTYCDKGCSFCYLKEHTNTKNKLQITNKDIDRLFEHIDTKIINFSGGDTFFEPKDLISLIKHIVINTNVAYITFPSELSKINSDIDAIDTINTICKKNNVEMSIKASINDMSDFHQLIANIKLLKNIKHSLFKVADKELIEGKLCFLNSLANEGKDNSLYVVPDYNLVSTNIDNNKIKQFVSNMEQLCTLNSNVVFGSTIIENCAIKQEGLYLGVDFSGKITDCVAIDKDTGIGELNYNIKDINDNIMQEIYKRYYKNQNNLYENKYCAKCSVAKYCHKCPKTINKTPEFKGNSTNCMLHRHLKDIGFNNIIEKHRINIKKQNKKSINKYTLYDVLVDKLTNNIVHTDIGTIKERKEICSKCEYKILNYCTKDKRQIKYIHYKDVCPIKLWEKKQ